MNYFDENYKLECPHLTSEEDHNQTTIYPKCDCECSYCSEFKGWCPIRD